MRQFGSGLEVLRINAMVGHRMGTLFPPAGQRPVCAQLYVLDSATQLDARMQLQWAAGLVQGMESFQFFSIIVSSLMFFVFGFLIPLCSASGGAYSSRRKVFLRSLSVQQAIVECMCPLPS